MHRKHMEIQRHLSSRHCELAKCHLQFAVLILQRLRSFPVTEASLEGCRNDTRLGMPPVQEPEPCCQSSYVMSLRYNTGRILSLIRLKMFLQSGSPWQTGKLIASISILSLSSTVLSYRSYRSYAHLILRISFPLRNAQNFNFHEK